MGGQTTEKLNESSGLDAKSKQSNKKNFPNKTVTPNKNRLIKRVKKRCSKCKKVPVRRNRQDEDDGTLYTQAVKDKSGKRNGKYIKVCGECLLGKTDEEFDRESREHTLSMCEAQSAMRYLI